MRFPCALKIGIRYKSGPYIPRWVPLAEQWMQEPGQTTLQGCHQSAWFEFPDFPWLFRRPFPWLSLTSRHRSDGYRVKPRAKQGKILHLQPLGFYKNMPRNQGQTLGHPSQIIFPDFPWLSTKNIEIPWLSLTFQKVKIFPDFPWFSLMVGTLIFICPCT